MLPSVIGGAGGSEFSKGSRVRSASVVAKAEGIVGDAGGGGDEAGGGGAEVAAVVVAAFGFVCAAVDFMAASSAVTGSGVMTVVGATPASPDCIELDSFTAMRTGTLWGR